MTPCRLKSAAWAALALLAASAASAAEDWPQLKFDARHSGNAPGRSVETPLGLIGAMPLGDAIFTAPVVAGGRVYTVDGSGAAFCFDAKTLHLLWRTPTRGGLKNCNNVSSPLVAGGYLHFGTMGGNYYVLDAADGSVVKEIPCGEPIFSAPVAGSDRVYFATLGSQVYALTQEGKVCWKWDYVRQQIGFNGDRWSGPAWLQFRNGRVSQRDMFVCSRDIALDGRTLVVPAGGCVVWLEDNAGRAELRRTHAQYTSTLGLSIGEDGTVYRQWHWLDNGGQVDILRPGKAKPNEVLGRGLDRHGLDVAIDATIFHGKEGVDFVAGTHSHTEGPLLSFCSVSLRGRDVFRCRPEAGFGLCRHSPGEKPYAYEGCGPSIASPLLVGDKAVYGGLDGSLYVAPLAGGKAWSFRTAFGRPITAPAAVCDGRIYFGCDDGYLYALGPGGRGRLPTRDLELWKVRSPLAGPRTDAKYDRFTSFADQGNTNAAEQGLRPPLRVQWLRRYEGTTKHFSSFGGGRMYTHTAEGQVFAVEEETGRLLWQRYFPGVFLSYTTPLYCRQRLLVPQAGLQSCTLRCLDAATGALQWEAPFAGSPSWNRQQSPVVLGDLVFYMFGTGRYGPEGTEKPKLPWLFEHQDVPGFPTSHRPLLRAYDLRTGRVAWTRDFSAYGCGGDEAGLCLLGERLFYSCFFGYAAKLPSGQAGPQGLTAQIEPATGKIVWLTTKYSIRGGATLSGESGRLYLGGYNPPSGSKQCRVWCLDARDGSLVWESDPLVWAIHVPTIGPDFIFVHSQYKDSYFLDKATGRLRNTMHQDYKCSRLTLAGQYLLAPAMDVWDVSDLRRPLLLSSGPRLDTSECTGACASNGRIFYTGQGGCMQASLAGQPQQP
jgi:outer membrane protein assembly factor BamB